MKTVGIVEFTRETGYSVKHITEQVHCGRIPASKIKGKWAISEKLVQIWKDRRKTYLSLRASL